MKYSRMRDYLSRSARDMRRRDMRGSYSNRSNRNSRDRRDYNYEHTRMGDMAYAREYNRGNADRNYYSSNVEMDGRNYKYDREYSRDGSRRVGYFDYETEDRIYNPDYGYDYGYDMARGRDYASDEFKLTSNEIRKWSKDLENADGSHGAKFTVSQVEQVAKEHGIRFDEFSPELLTLITNVMFSDYGEVIKSDISTYVKMAKAFLCDDDFEGEPEEKAYLYYTAIVDKEDE